MPDLDAGVWHDLVHAIRMVGDVLGDGGTATGVGLDLGAERRGAESIRGRNLPVAMPS